MSREPSFVEQHRLLEQQSEYEKEVTDYRDWLRKHRRTGYIFDTDSARQTYFFFDEDIRGEISCATQTKEHKLKKLIAAATNGKTVQARDVATDCPKVFSILLAIGQQQYIARFVSVAHLHDEYLPFKSDDGFPVLPGGATFWKEFDAEQWKYTVKRLKYSVTSVEFQPEMILPIASIDELSKRAGATAVVRKVKVHAQYDAILPENTSQSQLEKLRLTNDLNTYVIKSYHSRNASRYFDSEVYAFELLNRQPQPPANIVGFYKAFKQNHSCHIVLQYANVGTLEDYFKKCERPTLGRDILNLWSGLFQLNHAVSWIHTSRDPQGGDNMKQHALLGYHQDIKPANILVIGDIKNNPYEVEFMLADLGLSHFVNAIEKGSGFHCEDIPGVRTYGAPERNLKLLLPLSDYTAEEKQCMDIWALACVYSEFAMWVVQGQKGLEAYREARLNDGEHLGPVFHNVQGAVSETVERSHQDNLHRHANEDRVTPLFWRQFCEQLFTAPRIRLNIDQLKYSSEILLREAAQAPKPIRRADKAPASVRSARSSHSPPHTPPEVPPSEDDEVAGRSPSTPSRHQHSASSPPHAYRNGVFPQSPQSIAAFQSSPPLATTGPHSNLTSDGSVAYSAIGADRSDFDTLPHALQLQQSLTHRARGQTYSTGQDVVYELPPSIEAVRGQSDRYGTHAGPIDHEPVSSPSEMSHTAPRLGTGASGAYNLVAPMSYQQPHHEQHYLQRSVPLSVQRNPPRELTREQLHTWYERTKESKPMWGKGPEKKVPFEDECIGQLKRRDHIFIVDDSASMKPHWPDLKNLMQDLLYFIKNKKLDPNGSQVMCINQSLSKEAKDTTPLMAVIEQAKYNLSGATDFAARLEEVLRGYTERLYRDGVGQRPISIYVLTDGVWKRGTSGQEDYQLRDAERAIVRTVDALERLGADNKKVGIQLIRFGTDPVGIKRLEFLDAGLKEKLQERLKRDMCDTESATGNVWKMLLGSIDPYWDND